MEFLLTFFLALSAYGANPIQGGDADSSHPAVGMIWEDLGDICTGTLITPSVVLTAAHCVSRRIQGFYTGAGTPTNEFTGKPVEGLADHAIDKYAVHPAYKPSQSACPNPTPDIGLIHLASPINDTTPVGLSDGPPSKGASCTIVGYGEHSDETGDYFEQRRSGVEAILDVLPNALQLKFETAITDHGDSGGPLLCNGLISAVTSCHSDGLWPKHQIEFDARVDTERTWIHSKIKEWN